MDEFGYIYDLSNNDFDEFSVDENGISVNATGIIVEQDVDSSKASDTIEKELDDRKVETTFVSQNVDFTNSADSTGSRPRRNIRRPRKYDGFSAQFTNSQHIRRIRRDFQANLRSAFERPSFRGIRSQAAEPRAVAQVPRSEKLNEDISSVSVASEQSIAFLRSDDSFHGKKRVFGLLNSPRSHEQFE